MNPSVFTPALFVVGLGIGALLAGLELLWLTGTSLVGPWGFLAALSLLNAAFFLLMVSIRDSHFLLFVLPFPVIPALYLALKALLYHGLGRASGSPLRHPWVLLLVTLVSHPLIGSLAYQAFSRINPTLENLQLAIREKRAGRLEAMLWMSVKQEPSLSALVNEAIVRDDPDAARRLIRHGADPRREYWLRDASPAMLWLLTKWRLDSGVKPEDVNTSQGSPFEYVAVSYSAAELRYCIAKGFDPGKYPGIVYLAIDETPIEDPKTVGPAMTEKLQVLLDHGADVNGDGPMRFKPIFGLIVAKLDLSAVLLFLLEKGADVNARTVNPLYPDGKPATATALTPLIAAVLENRADYVDILLRHGADPSLRDSSGRSAADYATAPGVDEAIRSRLAAGDLAAR